MNGQLQNNIEVTPGPEQQRLDPQTAVAVTTLVEQNERLTLALRRIVIHLGLCHIVTAKTIAEEALERL
jgi:hypothetical protein